ncbi:glutamine--fructose-6-phosphate aminotransferase [Thermotoga sp. Ku-13t]|uniref:glutamine--fructose-6-phosphate transaminase (isomerizing) n=1 Tax=Thermotoga sp. Ku-13t TaxID=1755813 RepID=UPI0013ED3899|nr:glutamine--fructose-6-phosphate transaminase (isomerizing) [Thermotoga sp. Ku-13t]KAF2958667.1 glutamine--fructose-6-phosphate aminotransferase [Thermotoga sp. Ku-13t]
MCGIVGLVGEVTVSDLVEALERLEYRGYDSAGVAFLRNSDLHIEKNKGKVEVLKGKLSQLLGERIPIGIAHTRWATHGEPNDINAHPHTDCHSRLCVVHNGIIENFKELRRRLEEVGHRFVSDTDTEVIPHLIEEYYTSDLVEAVRKAVKLLEGSFAIAVMHVDHPDLIVGARKGSPLILTVGEKVAGVASDVTPLLKYSRDMVFLEDGDIFWVSNRGFEIFDVMGRKKDRKKLRVEWSYETAQKSGYKHYMLKEIFEEPSAVAATLSGRIKNSRVNLPEIEELHETLKNSNVLKVVACGTSSYASLSFKYFLENLCDISVDVEVSSEFRYKRPNFNEDTILIAVSQSGETADTLESVRLARSRRAKILAITNVVGSTLMRESDFTLLLNAGPEISVAATKSYVTQLVLLYLLGLKIVELKGEWNENTARILDGLLRLPEVLDATLSRAEQIREVALKYKDFQHFMYIGRGIGYPTALEGALKLKEISYIHATAYAAGELKHGPIALLGPDFPVFAISPRDALYNKVKNNMIECKARKAKLIALTSDDCEDVSEIADDVLSVNTYHEQLYPVLMAPVIQLFAYYIADSLGHDPDKPRNLAKSVTVE